MGNGRKSKHHIWPVSVGGSDNGDNISWVGQKLHDKYHALFNNKNPYQILDFLVNYFWKGKIHYVENYLEERRRKCG